MLPKVKYRTFLASPPTQPKKKYSFRPFSVGEEKILLTALEEGNGGGVIRAIIQLVINCYDLDEQTLMDMPQIDAQYLFLQARAKSVGEHVNLRFLCQNPDCGHAKKRVPIEVSVDLTDIPTVQGDSSKLKQLPIAILENGKSLYVDLKVPTIRTLLEAEEIEGDVDTFVLRSCIAQLYDEDQTYDISEDAPEDFEAWFSSLEVSARRTIEEAAQHLPKMEKKVEYACKGCGQTHSHTLARLGDFFQQP